MGQQSEGKRHAACDECRSRKLKCSQEHPQCARCRQENVTCVYSLQSKMGRPRKRQREDPAAEQSGTTESNALSAPDTSPTHSSPLMASPDMSQDIYGNFVHPGVMSFFDRNLASPPSAEILDREHPLISEALSGIFPEDLDMSTSMSLSTTSGALLAPVSESMNIISTEPLVDPLLQMRYIHSSASPSSSRALPLHHANSQLTHNSSPMLDAPSDLADNIFGAFHSSVTAVPAAGEYSLLSDGATAFPELPCSCLNKIHNMLTELQYMTSFNFPQALQTLTAGKRTAGEVLRCTHCLADGAAALQNTMLLTTLLSVLLERYRKVLAAIEADAAAIEAANGTIPFRMGDNSPALQHLHDGTLDCPMGFNIDLAPQEWRYLAKRAIKAEVKGNGGRDNSIVDLITQLEERQKRWHEDWHAKGNCLRCWHASGGTPITPHTDENCVRHSESSTSPADDPVCFRVTQLLRTMLDWSEW